MNRKRVLSSLASATLIGGSFLYSSPAHALGGEQLGCQVQPNGPSTYATRCKSHPGPTSYEVDFQIQNETAPSAYAWTIPSSYQSGVVYGCSSTSNACAIDVPNEDASITVSVTLSQGGSSETLTSTATILQSCGDVYC